MSWEGAEVTHSVFDCVFTEVILYVPSLDTFEDSAVQEDTIKRRGEEIKLIWR